MYLFLIFLHEISLKHAPVWHKSRDTHLVTTVLFLVLPLVTRNLKHILLTSKDMTRVISNTHRSLRFSRIWWPMVLVYMTFRLIFWILPRYLLRVLNISLSPIQMSAPLLFFYGQILTADVRDSFAGYNRTVFGRYHMIPANGWGIMAFW